jgi:hypothetical protein
METILKKDNDAQWQGLYEQARQLPNVNYIVINLMNIY